MKKLLFIQESFDVKPESYIYDARFEGPAEGYHEIDITVDYDTAAEMWKAIDKEDGFEPNSKLRNPTFYILFRLRELGWHIEKVDMENPNVFYPFTFKRP